MIASLETSSSFTAWIVTSALAWAFLLAPLPMILSRALRFLPNFSQFPAILDDLSAISCHFLRPFRLSGPVFFLPPFTSHARASRRFDCIGLVDSARWPRWHFQTGGSTTCTGDASFYWLRAPCPTAMALLSGSSQLPGSANDVKSEPSGEVRWSAGCLECPELSAAGLTPLLRVFVLLRLALELIRTLKPSNTI